jgi:hypothetical protein
MMILPSRRVRARTAGPGVVAAALLALCRCSPAGAPPPPGDAAAKTALLQARSDSGLEMRVLLSHDTIAPGGAVEAVYFVVNGPTPTLFLNHPGVIGVWVETEGGEEAAVSKSTSATPTPSGTQAEMTLPAHGVLGQRQDLRCVRITGYPAAGQAGADCGVVYRLDSPGRYHVIARYSPPAEGRFTGPVIADTTVLVIR